MIPVPVELQENEEFESLIDPIHPEELETLRADLREHGCISPILTWKGFIIDGHNRYRLCKFDGVSFETKEMNFADEEEAKIWILTNQVGRRNLSAWRRLELLKVRDDMVKKREKAKKKMLSKLNHVGDAVTQDTSSHKENVALTTVVKTTGINSRKDIAKELGIGEGTVERMEYVRKKSKEGKVPEDILQKLRSGKMKVGEAYRKVKGNESGSAKKPVVVSVADPIYLATKGSSESQELAKHLTNISSVLEKIEYGDIKKIESLETRNRIRDQLQTIRVNIERILKHVTEED